MRDCERKTRSEDGTRGQGQEARVAASRYLYRTIMVVGREDGPSVACVLVLLVERFYL